MLFIILPISMAVVFLMWTFSIIGNFGHSPTMIFGSGNRSWIYILMLHWILFIVDDIDDIDDIDNIWCRKGKDRYKWRTEVRIESTARHGSTDFPLRSAPLCTPTSPPTTRCFSKGFPARCTNWRKKSSAGLVLMMEIQMVLPPKTKIQIYLLDYSSM